MVPNRGMVTQIEKMQRPGRLEGVHHLQPSQRLRRWPSANRVCVLWLRASLGGAPLIPPTPQDRSAFTV
ncbi:unnamed protein product [Gadus morhua 'NCC']